MITDYVMANILSVILIDMIAEGRAGNEGAITIASHR